MRLRVSSMLSTPEPPVRIGVATFVTGSMTDVEPSRTLLTYTLFVTGFTATWLGPCPTAIVATTMPTPSTTVTELDALFATYTRFRVGFTATARGSLPAGIEGSTVWAVAGSAAASRKAVRGRT